MSSNSRVAIFATGQGATPVLLHDGNRRQSDASSVARRAYEYDPEVWRRIDARFGGQGGRTR